MKDSGEFRDPKKTRFQQLLVQGLHPGPGDFIGKKVVSIPYLEDGLPGRVHGYVMNNHGDRFRPLRIGLWDPFPNGRFMADINGGDPNVPLTSVLGAHPPSRLKVTTSRFEQRVVSKFSLTIPIKVTF